MRVRLSVRCRAREIPWSVVLSPGRGLAYGWLSQVNPRLGGLLHERGWGPYGMVPFGHGAPTFPAARRRRGTYAAGGGGMVEFGSPFMAVVDAWVQALATQRVLDWGGVALQVERVEVVEPPSFASGMARLTTATPVVVKGSGRNVEGVRTTRQAWLLPTEPEFPVYFAGNLRRKAETLGLNAQVSLERVSWVGAQRSFVVKDGAKPGARVGVEIHGAPETLQALWSWGLGASNAAGFGWVQA